jgi:hypothetical protein
MKSPDNTTIKVIELTAEECDNVPKDVVYTIIMYVITWCYNHMIESASKAIPLEPIYIMGFCKFLPKSKKAYRRRSQLGEEKYTNYNFRRQANIVNTIR